MKNFSALLCLAALLSGLFACGKAEEPAIASAAPTTAAETIPAATEPAGLRVEGYDFALEGEMFTNQDGTPERIFETDTVTCRYYERDGGIYLIYTMEYASDTVVLPAYVDGKPLLGADWTGLKNIKCRELRLPETMKDLCLSTSVIETLVIPKSLETISFDRSFYKTAEVDAENHFLGEIDGVLIDKGRSMLIEYPFLREGKSYTIPSSVKEIDGYTFYNVHVESELEEVIIPPTVTKFPDDYDSLSYTVTTIVAAPGSAAADYVKKYNENSERQLKLVLRDFD